MKTMRKGNKGIGRQLILLVALVAGVGLSAMAQNNSAFDPFNDTFGQRGLIGLLAPTGSFAAVGSLSNATFEAGEPFIDGVSSGQTVWAQWTAPSNGIVTLGIEAETFSPLLSVYAGSAPSAENPLGTFPGSAYIPSVFTNLSLVASNNYLIGYQSGLCGTHWRERSSITFHVARGQDYQVCVDSAIITDASMQQQSIPDGYGGSYLGWAPVFTTNVPPGGDFILDLNFTPAPANDDFAKRHKLSGTRIAITAANAGATKEPGEPDHLGNPGGSSVWYSWTAPASGRVTITTNPVPQYTPPTTSGGGLGVTIISVGQPSCGNEVDLNPPPDFYPVFAAYTGTAVNALTPADNLPMELPAFANGVEFDVLKGQTYQIAFDGNQGTTGEIPLDLELTTPPPNADPRHPIQLHGVSVTATGYNAGAALQPGPLNLGFPLTPPVPLPPQPLISTNQAYGNQVSNLVSLGYHPYKAAWWSWTAPVSGTVTIDTTGSDYAFPVTVIAEPAAGKPAGYVETGSGNVSFTAVQGRTYLIELGQAYEGQTGAIQLSLQAPIIDVPAISVARVRGGALLTYSASAGEVIALLYSADDQNWKIVQSATAGRYATSVQFVAGQYPGPAGPYYRAIIFDRVK